MARLDAASHPGYRLVTMKQDARAAVWPKWVGPAAFALVALVVFWEPVFSGYSHFSPDGAPIYAVDHHQRVSELFTGMWTEDVLGIGQGGRPFHPSRVLEMLLPPLAYHIAVYMLDTLLLFLAGAYFLAGRGLRGLTVWIPSLALAFSGYLFTLISAGHKGMFDMTPYAVFMFGCLDRAIERRSLYHFALAGLCAGFGLAGQPDVMLLYGLLAVAYGVFKLVVTWPAERRGAWALQLVGGVLLAGVVFGGVAVAQFGWAFGSRLPQRQELTQQSPEQKFEFATNWSMPPEEVLEFVAPAVYGFETQEPSGPYWGRVGRTKGWEQHHQGLLNLRQHTVYLGVLQLAFAAWAVAAAFRRRAGQGSAAPAWESAGRRSEVRFWLVAALVALVLALGRYTPVYKLFYMLPMAGNIRAPIKFLHLVEVAVAWLFAFGLENFLAGLLPAAASAGSGAAARKGGRGEAAAPACGALPHARGFAIGLGVCAALLVVGAAGAGLSKDSLFRYWQELARYNYGLGLNPDCGQMLGRLTGALLHGALLFGVAAALFGLAARRTLAPSFVVKAAWVVLAAVAVDVGLVAKPYVHVRDVAPYYAANPVAARIKSDPLKGRLSWHVTSRAKLDPVWNNLYHHNIETLEPSAETQLSEDYLAFFGAVQQSILRLWELTNTRYIALPAAQWPNLEKVPGMRQVLLFNVASGMVAEALPGQHANVLVRFEGALPRAAFYTAWESHPAAELLKRLAAPDWNPARSVLLPEGAGARESGSGCVPAEIVRYGRQHVTVRVNAPEAGVLLLNDKYDANWKAGVDGQPAELLRANGIMRAVRVPAGSHTVDFDYHPYRRAFGLSLSACGLLLAWTALRAAAAWRRRPVASATGEGAAA